MRRIVMALMGTLCLALSTPASFAQGGGGGGGAGGGGSAGGASGASGTAGGSAGSTGGMSGSAGTGNTSTGIGASTGASSQNTVGQTNREISPSNPSTTQPGGTNAVPVPNGTTTQQNPQQFDPRLSPGYQK